VLAVQRLTFNVDTVSQLVSSVDGRLPLKQVSPTRVARPDMGREAQDAQVTTPRTTKFLGVSCEGTRDAGRKAIPFSLTTRTHPPVDPLRDPAGSEAPAGVNRP